MRQDARWSEEGIGRDRTFQNELGDFCHGWWSVCSEADGRSNKAQGHSTFETQGYEWGSHDYLGFVGGPL